MVGAPKPPIVGGAGRAGVEAVSSKMFEADERWMKRSKGGERQTWVKRRYALVRRETGLRDT